MPKNAVSKATTPHAFERSRPCEPFVAPRPISWLPSSSGTAQGRKSSLTGPRRFPLRHCTATARLPLGGKRFRAVHVELVDLGFSGLGLETRESLPPGAALTIQLDVPGLSTQIWPCRVVSVHSFDGEKYRTGLVFENPQPS